MSQDIQPARNLVERLSRLSEADDWQHGLNPAQSAVLRYLARANRFSRSPKHVTAYLGATKGTVSQTLKALSRKGLLVERPSAQDRRSLRFDVTPEGRAVAARAGVVEEIIADMGPDERATLEGALADLLSRYAQRIGAVRFGICARCRHHRVAGDGQRHCALLDLDLAPPEAEQVCFEFAA